jgi:hypothetical protein
VDLGYVQHVLAPYRKRKAFEIWFSNVNNGE